MKRLSRSAVTRSVLGLALVGGAALAAGAQATPSASYSVKGIDISRYQHPNGAAINWPQVKASGVKFVIVGATQGTSSTPANPYFKADYQAVKDAGLIRGAYHFATPSAAGGLQNEAVREAQAFLTAIGGTKTHEAGTMAPVLDLETRNGLSDADLATWTRAFSNEVFAQTGRQAIVYVSACFFATGCNGLPASIKDLPTWIAAYTSAANPQPKGWSMWQYSSSLTVPGISGSVDTNVYSGSLDSLVNNLGEGRTHDILNLWGPVSGGTNGSLGVPKGDESQVAAGVWEQDYSKGIAVWSRATGAMPLHDRILDYWRQHGAQTLLPTSYPFSTAGGVGEEFQGADVFDNGTTGTALTGDVRDLWRASRSHGQGQGLGVPLTDMTVANPLLASQEFTNGRIVRTAAGLQVFWNDELLPGLPVAHSATGPDAAPDAVVPHAVADGVGVAAGRALSGAHAG